MEYPIDCDDVMLLIAAKAKRTLSGLEETHLHQHLETCEECQALEAETSIGPTASEDWRWVAQVPEDALDDESLLVLPVIDPVLFTNGQVIATGGMGRITRATDRRLGRDVALKEVLAGGLRARFEREAAITARLQHPAIVPIYEAGQWPDGSAFYTMRLVDGSDLAKAIGNTETLAERIALLPHVVAATEALAYAHARGIIHRDLKPGNILVGKYGETVVIDWGIAKQLGSKIDDVVLEGPVSNRGLTRVGTLLGTPGFMSPEQARGGTLDERADVFALGGILYNLLAGTPPFYDRCESAEEVLDQSLTRSPTPLVELAPDAPPDLIAIVDKAMARAPADRYANAAAMAEELRRFEAGKLIARAYTLRELIARWLRKHRTAVLIGTLATVALAVVAVIAVINVRASRDAERTARAEAEDNLSVARATAAASLEEQARTEVIAGDRARGLAYAAAAFDAGRDTPTLRYLLATASRDVSLLRHVIEPPDLTTSCGNDPNCAAEDVAGMAYDASGDLMLVESTGRLSKWRDGKRISFTPLGHEVQTAAFNATVTRVAVAGESLAVWNVATSTKLWTATDDKLKDALATELVIDAHGKWVLALPDDGATRTLVVRDLETGTIVKELAVGDHPISRAAFSADGARLVAAAKDGKTRVWATADFRELAVWTGAPNPTSIAFAGPDRVVVDGEIGDARTVVVWDVAAARKLYDLGVHHTLFARVAATADGTLIATGDDQQLRLWNAAGEPVAATGEPRGRIERVVFAGPALVVQALDNRLFVYETATLKPRAIVDAHEGFVSQVAVDGAGTRIATTGLHDQRVREWAMPAGPRIASVPGSASAIAGDRWVVASATQLAFYRTDTGAAAGTLAIDLDGSVTLEVAGSRLLAHGSRRAVIVDLANPTAAIPIAVPEDSSPELASDGRYVVAQFGDRNDKVRIWDAATGKQIRDHQRRKMNGVTIAGDRLVITVGRDVEIYEVASDRQIAKSRIGGPEESWDHLLADPQGKVVVGFNTTHFIVLEAAGGTVVARGTHDHDVDSAPLLAPDGLLLATLGEDGINLWDTLTGKPLARIAPDATEVAVAADGKRLATSREGTVRLWDVATGRQLDRLDLDREPIKSLAFSRDGTRLLIATKTGVTLADVHLETRDAAAIGALAAKLPWKVESGVAVPR